jgi:hypothetical protein
MRRWVNAKRSIASAMFALVGALGLGFSAPAYAQADGAIPPLKLQGRVDRAMYEALLAYPGETIIITSDGGSIAWGISIAEFVSRRGMTVRAEGRCLSACFDYVLLPAKRRQVGPDTLLGMHPGPLMLEQMALADGRPVPDRTVQFAALHREALRLAGITGVRLHMLGAVRMDVTLVSEQGGCWFEGAPSEEGLTDPDCFRYTTGYAAWYPSTAQLRALGIEIEGPEIAFNSVDDVLAFARRGWSDRASAFGECLYDADPAPVLVCPGGAVSRAARLDPLNKAPPLRTADAETDPPLAKRGSTRIRNLARPQQ